MVTVWILISIPILAILKLRKIVRNFLHQLLKTQSVLIMAAKARPQTMQEDQEQRDKINRVDFTIQEVVLPTLQRMEQSVQIFADKDFLTEDKADKRYPTMQEFKALKAKVDSHSKVGGTIATLLIAGLISLFYAVISAKVLK